MFRTLVPDNQAGHASWPWASIGVPTRPYNTYAPQHGHNTRGRSEAWYVAQGAVHPRHWRTISAPQPTPAGMRPDGYQFAALNRNPMLPRDDTRAPLPARSTTRMAARPTHPRIRPPDRLNNRHYWRLSRPGWSNPNGWWG